MYYDLNYNLHINVTMVIMFHNREKEFATRQLCQQRAEEEERRRKKAAKRAEKRRAHRTR